MASLIDSLKNEAARNQRLADGELTAKRKRTWTFRAKTFQRAVAEIERLTAENEQWKNAARLLAALYGANVNFDGGSWFRDNIEISLDGEIPDADIEALLDIAWKAARTSVNEALQTNDTDPTPYCHVCNAMTKQQCTCPDPFYAENH